VIGFDAALTDGANPPKLQSACDTWDLRPDAGPHPSPAGYKKMDDTVDLTLFTK